MKNETFHISFRCYYPNGEPTTHYQDLQLRDIPKWVNAYKYTHPQCESITIKLWFTELNINTQNDTM